MEECDPAVLKEKVEKAKTILYKVRKYLTPPGWEVKLITCGNQKLHSLCIVLVLV